MPDCWLVVPCVTIFDTMNRLKIAFIIMALAVALGAFGAHGLENRVGLREVDIWKTGALYHFIHGLGLMGLALFSNTQYANSARLKWAQNLILLGIVFFSGSLYLLSTRSLLGVEWTWLGPVTPIGGACFIAGWIMAALSVKKI
jgi:uncharacterized membrane protein YgdD (TMEM256/DUF423 family)